MTVETTIEPAVEPVSLAEAKAHLRVDFADEDALISALIVAARRMVENFIRCRLITQTVTITVDGFGTGIGVPLWPVQSITSVKYDDTDNAEQTMAATDYQLVKTCKPPMIMTEYQVVWPTARADYGSVRAEVVVGYGDAATNVPQDIIQAIYMLIGDMYEQRENTAVGATTSEMPFGVREILTPHILWI